MKTKTRDVMKSYGKRNYSQKTADAPPPQPPPKKRRTKLYIGVTFAVILVVSILFIVVSTFFLGSLLSRIDTRGLQITQVWRTNDGWFPTVENQGSETVYITRFYNENGAEIRTSVYDRNQFWNDDGYYELPSGKFMTLILTGTEYYSNEIYVDFSDGYTAKIYG